ncbi:MAG: hypothetical protein H7Y86_14745 [Rhizobacter sp.]|nr:hypothetical protein [Ferruginibacter sp.]
MKQLIKTIAATLFVSLGIATLSFAQDMLAVNSIQAKNTTVSNGETNYIETIAEANFSSLFPNATHQKWHNVGVNSFVSFLNNGRKATASFNARGEINYVITQCSTENLPAAFSKTIKKNYVGYQLFHGSEIKAHGETAYQAVLESATGFITLKYTGDGVEEIQQVKK